MEGRKKIFKRRQRKAPNRKWSEDEHRKILEFLKENIDTFERPTAQIFYTRFIYETKFPTEWNLVRYKVRNLRTSYAKARLLKNSTSNFIKSDQEAIRRICPYFDQLDEIFADKPNLFNKKSEYIICNEALSENDSLQNSTDFIEMSAENKQHMAKIFDSSVSKNHMDIVELSGTNSDSTDHSNSNALKIRSDLVQLREQQTNNGITNSLQILQSAEENLEQKDDNYLWEREGHLRELRLREKQQQLELEKFQFERERFHKEFELNVREQQWQAELKQRELEMKERITMRELEIKEKIALKELEIHHKTQFN
uniref:Myb/SANT-like DNA-binding domain-containing protein n=1 Tax=Glossina brevipalpis TaxID=37001 RepID=A0A1A9W5K3_9MUSC